MILSNVTIGSLVVVETPSAFGPQYAIEEITRINGRSYRVNAQPNIIVLKGPRYFSRLTGQSLRRSCRQIIHPVTDHFMELVRAQELPNMPELNLISNI